MGNSSEARSLQNLSVNLDDRILCELCGRYFNDKVFEKHLTLCADRAKRDIILRRKSSKKLAPLKVEAPMIMPMSSVSDQK